jgi:hypothetical protein
MKHFIPILMAAGIMTLVPACKEKKPSTDIIATKYVPKKPQPPIAMASDVRESQVEWGGKKYTVRVERVSDKELPLVKDESEQEFIDNIVNVSVVRDDGSVFFSKTFQKSSFASYIDERYRMNGLLDGLVFTEAKGADLIFAVSIAMPESDEFIPLTLAVNNQGTIAIERDSAMDTWGETESSVDDGV